MCAHKVSEPRSFASSTEALLTWVGGGERRELGERHERSAHALVGVVVILDAALAWLVTTLAIAQAAHWPVLGVLPLTVVLGLLVGAIARAVATGSAGGLRAIAGRGAVAVALGVVVGEFAGLVLFSGSIDHRLEQQAARDADTAPAVVQASATLQQTRAARSALDQAVDTARVHRDEALVVARCEYHPTPACPQTHITGVPGVGPETRTANELLADSQQELDNAVAARDRRAAGLDSQINTDQQALDQARRSAMSETDRGLGARWVAMQDLTLASGAALLLRLLTIGFFVLLSLLPLILRLWRGETSHDRHAAARAERERAELQAETAIAVKRAEVRAAAETMWAEQQLAQARLAVAAQTEIDREASGPAELPAAAEDAEVVETENVPAVVEPRLTIPDVSKTAARWLRPLVPTIVARAVDATTQPVRAARKVFHEVEEITFALKRTRTVTMHVEDSGAEEAVGAAADDLSLAPGEPQPEHELTGRDRPLRLHAADGVRQLPPAE